MRSTRGVLVSTAIGIVALCSSMASAPAVAETSTGPAETIRIVASGSTAKGGWVAFTGSGTSRNSAELKRYAVSVGGGSWDFGAYFNAIGQKVCYSHYYHPSARHGSTAIMNAAVSRVDVGPGATSYARVTKYTLDTCYAYWR